MRNTFALLFLTAVVLKATGLAQAREPIPIDAFAKVPEVQLVSMSTDGKYLVALVPAPGSNHQETALATWQIEALDRGSTLTPSGDRMRFIAASALKAGKIMAVARQEWTGRLAGCGEGRSSGATKTFVTKVYLSDTSLKDFSEAFTDNVRRLGVSEETQRCLEIAGSARLVDPLPMSPDSVIIMQLNELTLATNYYLYNLQNKTTRLLFRGGGRSQPGVFDQKTGEVLTRSQLEPAGSGEYEQRIEIKASDGTFKLHPKLSTKLTERHTVDIVGREEKTGKYYVLTDLFSDLVQAWMYDPVKQQFDKEALLAHPKFSVAEIIMGNNPSNYNRVLGFRINGVRDEQTFLDPAMKAIHDLLKKSFPNQGVTINSFNEDLSRLLFTTSSAQNPPAYHLLLDRKEVKTVGSQRPWIKPEQIGEQRWITYKARDGMEIPALLDLPVGWKPSDGPLPAIVHPHGGPWARDQGGWDRSGWVPFLTSRGYAVLRPQYRGSTGLGRKLWIAGDAQWGQAMQDDNDDAAAWLVSQNIASRDRIAIFGYSYGGFAAAAAAVRPNGPFQCAISGAPVTDLGRLGTAWSDNRVQRILQGRTVKGMDPIRNTDKASIPILLYVGDRDVRTPAFHAQSFHDAVKGKVASRLEMIPDMPHSMPWYYRHHEKTLGLIESYLAKECRPNGL